MLLLIEMLIISARRWVRILLAHKQIGKSAIHKFYHGVGRELHALFQVG